MMNPEPSHRQDIDCKLPSVKPDSPRQGHHDVTELQDSDDSNSGTKASKHTSTHEPQPLFDPVTEVSDPDLFMESNSQPWVVTPYDGPSTEGRIVLPELDLPQRQELLTPFVPPSDESPIRRKAPNPAEWHKVKVWAIVGLGFWITAALLWVVLLNQSGYFHTPSQESESKTVHR